MADAIWQKVMKIKTMFLNWTNLSAFCVKYLGMDDSSH